MDTLSENIIPSLVTDLFSEKVLDIAPIIGNGSVNQIFIVKTDQETLVVRLNKDRGLDEFIKERWCIEQASAQGVPGPKVLDLGEKSGHSYMVQSFLEGTVGTQNPESDKTKEWKEMGKFAKLIHQIPVEGIGLKLVDLNLHRFDGSWQQYLDYNIESLNPDDQLIKLGVLSPAESEQLKQLFTDLSKLSFNFGLNHGDLSLKNIMISPEGGISLFDWGSAEAHIVPHHDFGEILKSSIHRTSPEFDALLEGYGMTEHQYQAIEKEVHALMLLRAVDKLRWAIDRSTDNIPEFIKRVKDFYTLNFR